MLYRRSGKLIFIAIALLSMLASVWGTAFAASYTDTSADFGGQGVVMPAGLNRDNLQVELVKPSSVGAANLRFRGPILDISYNINGNELTFPPSLTYVYFNMNAVERAAWDRGSADIYYRDASTNSWKRCGTTFVVQADNPQAGRLACVAPQFTMFGLGISRDLEQLRPGLAISEGNVNASVIGNTARFGNQGVDVPAGFNSNQIHVRMLDTREAPAMPFHPLRRVIQLEWVGNLTQNTQQVQSYQQQTATSTITNTATTSSTVATGVSASASPSMPLSMTYIYFNVNNSQRNDWDQGNLHIYYYNQSSKTWSLCPAAFFVNLTADGDNSRNEGEGRIACVAPQFTYYALGMPRNTSERQAASQSQSESQ